MSYEEDDFSKIYEYSDLVKNTEQVQIDGKEKSKRLESFGFIGSSLSDMEAFARDVEFSKGGVGFEIKPGPRGGTVVRQKPLGKRYYSSLVTFFRHLAFSESHVYSPHVSAVCEALKTLGFQRYTVIFDDPAHLMPSMGKTCGEVFNDVITEVAEIVGTRTFKERLRTRRRNAERNEAKGLAIEQKVFESKSRQLVLMLHFGYQEQYRQRITLDEIQAHRKKFFNNCRTNKLLGGIVDYIWKLEEGNESGLHLHILIFYSAESCRDVYIAQQIGEYWKTVVTGGKGQYWNSNANKWLHKNFGHGVGTGEIEWHEEEKREALRTNIRYMTKADQYLRMKYGEHCRLFGTSQVQEKKKLGRPRKQPALDVVAIDGMGRSDSQAAQHADLDE